MHYGQTGTVALLSDQSRGEERRGELQQICHNFSAHQVEEAGGGQRFISTEVESRVSVKLYVPNLLYPSLPHYLLLHCTAGTGGTDTPTVKGVFCSGQIECTPGVQRLYKEIGRFYLYSGCCVVLGPAEPSLVQIKESHPATHPVNNGRQFALKRSNHTLSCYHNSRDFMS